MNQVEPLTEMPLKDTRSLRLRLIKSFEQHQRGEISNAFVRAQAFVAREILDTIKVEIVASRVGLRSFAPVNFDSPPQQIDATPNVPDGQ